MALPSQALEDPPKDAEPKRSKHAVRRSQILDAAASVFAEIGYMRASTGDIAGRLGMRQSNLYYYFRSKDEALAEICVVALEGYIRRITEILDGEAPFADKLRAAVRAHLLVLIERPDHFVTFLTCRHELPDEARREVGLITREYEALVERLITEGIENGDVVDQVDPRFAASSLLALCHNPVLYRKDFLGRSLAAVANDISNIFLGGITAPRPAQKGGEPENPWRLHSIW
jgi:AcrR family transcriptional regulator